MKAGCFVGIVLLWATSASAESAEQLYSQGQAAYDRADYSTAIAKWSTSYSISKEPLLLVNVAQAYRLGGDCLHALASYRQFLVEGPPVGEAHDLAVRFVIELEPKCGDQVTPQRGVVNAPNDHRGRGQTPRISGLVAGGAGIAAITTGLALGHHGTVLGDEVTAACATSCSWAAERDKDAAGRRDVLIGNVLDAVGAVAVIGGAVAFYLGVREGAVVVPHEGGAIVSWGKKW